MGDGFVDLSQISIDWNTGDIYLLLDKYRKQVWRGRNWMVETSDAHRLSGDDILVTNVTGYILPRNIPNKQPQDANNFISTILMDSRTSKFLFGGYNYIYSYKDGVYAKALSMPSKTLIYPVQITAEDDYSYLFLVASSLNHTDTNVESTICSSDGGFANSCYIESSGDATGVSSGILSTTNKCNSKSCDFQSGGICWNDTCYNVKSN